MIVQTNGWGSVTWEYELPNATKFIELRNLIASRSFCESQLVMFLNNMGRSIRGRALNDLLQKTIGQHANDRNNVREGTTPITIRVNRPNYYAPNNIEMPDLISEEQASKDNATLPW